MRIIAFMTERDDIDRGRNANGQPAHQTLALELVDLLPGGSDDRCAERLTHELAEKNTVVDKVHVIDRDTLKPRLCVHYDADAVTASEIQRHALQAAQTINTEYGHLRWAMVETEGVAPAQSAALIDRLSSTPGVVAAVVTRDSVEVEFQRTRVTAQELVDIIAAGPAPTPPASSATAFDDRHAGKADDHSEHEHSHGGIFGGSEANSSLQDLLEHCYWSGGCWPHSPIRRALLSWLFILRHSSSGGPSSRFRSVRQHPTGTLRDRLLDADLRGRRGCTW